MQCAMYQRTHGSGKCVLLIVSLQDKEVVAIDTPDLAEWAMSEWRRALESVFLRSCVGGELRTIWDELINFVKLPEGNRSKTKMSVIVRLNKLLQITSQRMLSCAMTVQLPVIHTDGGRAQVRRAKLAKRAERREENALNHTTYSRRSKLAAKDGLLGGGRPCSCSHRYISSWCVCASSNTLFARAVRRDGRVWPEVRYARAIELGEKEGQELEGGC